MQVVGRPCRSVLGVLSAATAGHWFEIHRGAIGEKKLAFVYDSLKNTWATIGVIAVLLFTTSLTNHLSPPDLDGQSGSAKQVYGILTGISTWLSFSSISSATWLVTRFSLSSGLREVKYLLGHDALSPNLPMYFLVLSLFFFSPSVLIASQSAYACAGADNALCQFAFALNATLGTASFLYIVVGCVYLLRRAMEPGDPFAEPDDGNVIPPCETCCGPKSATGTTAKDPARIV